MKAISWPAFARCGARCSGLGTSGSDWRAQLDRARCGVHPQLARTISSVGSISNRGGSEGSSIRSSSREQARSPSSRIGWWTVVRAGESSAPGKMSSKPTTATSSGTRTPAGDQLANGADRHLVVAADDRVRQLAARLGEEVQRGTLAADRGEPALDHAGQHRARVVGRAPLRTRSVVARASGASDGPAR